MTITKDINEGLTAVVVSSGPLLKEVSLGSERVLDVVLMDVSVGVSVSRSERGCRIRLVEVDCCLAGLLFG
jgi:hypothetical protein